MAAGCGSKPPATAPKKKPDKKEEVKLPDQTLNLPNGNSTQYSKDAAREPQWYVEWERAKVEVAQAGAQNARMEGVSGFLYKEGSKVVSFKATGGLANKAEDTLMLQGSVIVVSSDPKATLTCDRLIYDAKAKVIRALGHVNVVGQVGTIGTLSELWATRDLSVVATPDMFKAR
jgi:hypothetical protein